MEFDIQKDNSCYRIFIVRHLICLCIDFDKIYFFGQSNDALICCNLISNLKSCTESVAMMNSTS